MPMRTNPRKFANELNNIYRIAGSGPFQAKQLGRSSTVGPSAYLRKLSINGYIKRIGYDEQYIGIWQLNAEIVARIERGDL